ncbi:MAG: hypothetical protein NWE89_07515 [Candidatus Bathyarchaeota archaeon]|nr:hypothetical protein [Candidatus Bathyarchaeota archaeon]
MRLHRPVILAATLMLLVLPNVYAADYSLINLELVTYNDGVTDIYTSFEVDPSKVRVDVPLIGYPFQGLQALDQDGLPLDAEVTPTGATVDTLGSTELDIVYLTSALTSKLGTVWTLNFSSPITSTVQLPPSSTIVSLSDVPLYIDTEEDSTILVMLPGDISVSYITTIIDPRGIAQEALDEATAHIAAIKLEGVQTLEADTLLTEAEAMFLSEEYSETVTLAAQAMDAADAAKEKAQQATSMIEEASHAVTDAEAQGRTQGIEEAKQDLDQATTSYDEGEYQDSYTSALQAKLAAETAVQPQINTMLLIGGGALVITLGIVGYLIARRKPEAKPVEQAPIRLEVDLKAIFKAHMNLRMDDKEVIRFIAENGGEVFAMEIRDRFEIPRTSLWRMIRRLIGFGILEERKVGGQSLVRIVGRYRK